MASTCVRSGKERMTADIHELPKATLQDVANVLRSIADRIDAGDYGEVQAAALVMEDSDGNIRTFGAGAADYYRAFSMFQFGLAHLLAQRGPEFMV